jgi:nicotinate phosphoribosyltransferase
VTSALLTDLYQLTMAQGYFLRRRDPLVAFELFFRRPPFGGGYALAAGAEDAVDTIAALRFTTDELAYLQGLGLFRDEFLAFLGEWQFRGALHAVPEGTAMFPGEPLVRVTARLTEAQLVESMLLNVINFQTLIATKAARIVQAASGGPVLEFGLRRAQGRDGALSAARAAYIGGVQGTSNVAAGQRYGIPVGGTMAHSWIQSFASEQEAFDHFAELYPERAILLIDTYDTLASGIPHAIPALTRLQEQGHGGFGVRLDSGDLGPLSHAVRARLDAAGLQRARIVASNDLDETRIAELRDGGAPIDVWGVGTRLVTAYDDPALGGVYKLVAVHDGADWQPSAKRSEETGKATLPGIKQVVRCSGPEGATEDLLCLDDEALALAANARPGELRTPLLAECLRDGQRVAPVEPLNAIRDRASASLESLPPATRAPANPAPYPVTPSPRLIAMQQDQFAALAGTGP